jgi:hypothetical protein
MKASTLRVSIMVVSYLAVLVLILFQATVASANEPVMANVEPAPVAEALLLGSIGIVAVGRDMVLRRR